MNWYLNRAKELYDETVRNRRYIHQNAELGMELPKTVAYVREQLESYGYEVHDCGGGLTCTVGSGGKVFMIRGDMDALPQDEVSGVPYSCTTGACHSCGHDTHTAMLLCAAKMLKEREAELKGTVKFMFQPGEEVLAGAKAMIEAGILESPHVDAAMALHSSGLQTGTVRFYTGGMKGAREFHMTVRGKASHGSAPHAGVSALSIAANIVVAVQQIVSMEVDNASSATITFGTFNAGEAVNINPGEAELSGTIRTYDAEELEFMVRRFEELSTSIAAGMRGSVELTFGGVVPFRNDPELARELYEYVEETSTARILVEGNDRGADDFAYVSQKIPTIQGNIGTGSPEEGYKYPGHNPHRTLNEEGMPYGAATYAYCAEQWLTRHADD